MDIISHEYNQTIKLNNEGIKTRCITKEEVYQSSIFHIRTGGEELLRFERNGDIYVKGKLIENDKQVVEAFREYFKLG